MDREARDPFALCEEIEKELRELVDAGYKEITLLGQNVNSYGKDLALTWILPIFCAVSTPCPAISGCGL